MLKQRDCTKMGSIIDSKQWVSDFGCWYTPQNYSTQIEQNGCHENWMSESVRSEMYYKFPKRATTSMGDTGWMYWVSNLTVSECAKSPAGSWVSDVERSGWFSSIPLIFIITVFLNILACLPKDFLPWQALAKDYQPTESNDPGRLGNWAWDRETSKLERLRHRFDQQLEGFVEAIPDKQKPNQ